jgi:hypothetical protein
MPQYRLVILDSRTACAPRTRQYWKLPGQLGHRGQAPHSPALG